MIIDLILDRKELEEELKQQNATMQEYKEWFNTLPKHKQVLTSKPYNVHDFYWQVHEYDCVFKGIGQNILNALDNGTEQDVKNALCNYVKNGQYNTDICEYINSVEWLQESI